MTVSSSYVPHLLLCQYGRLRNVKLCLLLLDYGILRSGAPIIFCDERLIYYKMLRHICSLLKIKESAFIFSAAVPQARKASLARFLEKRKERYGECILLSVICNGEKMH